jgi:SAM-dependent methyltransferase
MIGFIARVFYFFDRIFPRVRIGGRESRKAYSEWEYREGKDLLDRYAPQFGSIEGALVLDVGCGMGGKTVAYAEAGARAVGVDLSMENVTASIRYAASRVRRAFFIAADAESLPFADGTFDLVVANDSLEHFPDPARAFGELSRVLNSGGGLFLFFTPWGSPLGSHLYDYIKTPWCHLLFSEKLLEEMLTLSLGERGESDAVGGAAALMERYRSDLNRITIRRYRRIREEHPELESSFERHLPPKFRALTPLTRLPFVREFFTGTVVALLRKR